MRRLFYSLLIACFLAIAGSSAWAAAPTTQAYNVAFSNVSTTGMSIYCSRGDGEKRIIVVKQGQRQDITVATPTNGTVYSANSAFGTPGTAMADGSTYVVYNGTGRSVNVTGLTAGAYYTVEVYEYNDDGATEYKTSEGSSNNPRETYTVPAAPTLTHATNLGTTSFVANWSEGSIYIDGYDFKATTSGDVALTDYDGIDVGDVLFNAVEDLTNGTTYKYLVCAKMGTRTSAWAAPHTVKTMTDPAMTGTATVCEGAAGILYSTADAFSSYTWAALAGGTVTAGGTGADQTETVTWTTAGAKTVSVDVTDGNSNTGTITYSTTVNPAATANAGIDQTVCAGSTATMAGVIGGGASSATWSTAGDGAFDDPTSLTAVYTPGATDISNGSVVLTLTTDNPAGPCGAQTDAMILTINALPTATIAAGGPTTFCEGGDVTLTASAADSYLWSTGATTQAITVSESGSYTVTVTDGNGCENTSAATVVTVNPLPQDITLTETEVAACQGVDATVTIPVAEDGVTYAVKDGVTTVGTGTGDGVSDLDITIDGALLSAGVHELTIDATKGTCTSTLTSHVWMSVNVIPSDKSLATTSGTICLGTATTTVRVTLAQNGVLYTVYDGTTSLGSGTGTGLSLNITVNTTGLSSGLHTLHVVASQSSCERTLTNTYALTVNPTTSITAQPASQAICDGGSVTFSVTAAGAGLSYQWKKNDVSMAGKTASTLTINPVSAGDAANYTVVVTGTCGSTATSDAATLTVTTPVTPSVTVAAEPAGTICEGTEVTFTATPANGGETPSYQWKLNDVNVGTDSPTYTNAALANNDVVSVVMTTSETCVTGPTGTGSITMDVTTPVTPSVAIAADPAGTICSGSSVTFTATPTNGGSTPAYQWSVNSIPVEGATSDTYTSSELVDGDLVTVDMTTSETCSTAASATSNVITMDVTTTVTPSVTIAALPVGTICSGTSVTFTATPTNGGLDPTYQWAVNGTGVPGENASTFTSTTLHNGDVVSVEMGTSLTCYTAESATSNEITMDVTTPVTPSVAISAVPAGEICEGTSVTFTATPTNGGTTPLYQWSLNGTPIGGATNSTYTNATLANGDVVSVEMTSDLTCVTGSTATSSVTEVVNALPTAGLTSSDLDNSICAGQSVTFTATGGTSYEFFLNDVPVQNGTSATYTTTTLASGDDVYVIATNAAGCTDQSATITTTVNAAPTATITPSGSLHICDGGSVTLTANASTSYLWSTGATSQSITVSAAGSYTVTVTNASGCLDMSDAAVVTVGATPTKPTIAAGGPTTFCEGGSVTLTSSAASTYLWNTGATTRSITVSDAGSYTVTVTDGNECSNTSDATVVTVNALPAQPTIAAGGPTTFCEGGSVVLTASAGASYLWSNGETTQSITATISGDYTVEVSNGTCSNISEATTVTVNPLPAATITAEGETTFCEGGSVTLTASEGTTYLWSNGETTRSIIVTEGGDYTVEVSNGTCSNTSEATAVTVNPLPTATINQTGIVRLCEGQSTVLTASEGTSYLWSNGATTQSITVTLDGNYSVTVSNGTCEATSDATFVEVSALPSAPTVAGTTVCSGSTATLNVTTVEGETYNWYTTATGGESFNTDASYTTGALTGTTSYYVEAVNANGCPSATRTQVTVTINHEPTLVITNPDAVTSPATVDLTAAAVTSGSTLNGGTLTYWTDADATVTLATPAAVATSGTYYIKAENSCGHDIEAVTVTVNVNPPPVLSITNPDAVCRPSTVDLTAAAVTAGSELNGGTLSYWTNVEATNALTTPSAVSTSGTYYIKATNDYGSDIEPVTVTVNIPVEPTVTIVSNKTNPICEGTSVTFTATPVLGGTTPTYQWRVNGDPVQGETASTFTSTTLANNDVVTVEMTTSLTCAWPLTATSNDITMHVSTPVTPSVTIAAEPAGAICQGTSVTFTATPVNGGSAPTYQWKVNGSNAGTNSATFTSTTLANGDAVTVVMTSNEGCVTTATATSGAITMTVNPLPVLTVHNPAEVCEPLTVDLTAAAVTTGSTLNGGTLSYWTDADATTAVADPTAVAVGGTYYVKAENSCGRDIKPVTVTIAEKPTTLAISTTVPNITSGNSFSVTVESKKNGAVTEACEDIPVTIQLNNGTGTLSGTLAGTIAAGTSSVTISGIVYTNNHGEASVSVKATSTGLTAGNSNSFTVMAAEPTTQASSIVWNSFGINNITLSWTNGNGAGRVVLCKQSSTSISDTPADGSTYTGNANFSLANELGTSKVVYSGTGNSVAVTGLTRNTRYCFRIFEFNGLPTTAATMNYMTGGTNNQKYRYTSLREGYEGEDELPLKGETHLAVSNFMPNPVKDRFSFNMELSQPEKVTVSVFTEDGRLVTKAYDAVEFGTGRHMLDVQFNTVMAAGNYTVVINAGNDMVVDHIVVLP